MAILYVRFHYNMFGKIIKNQSHFFLIVSTYILFAQNSLKITVLVLGNIQQKKWIRFIKSRKHYFQDSINNNVLTAKQSIKL